MEEDMDIDTLARMVADGFAHVQAYMDKRFDAIDLRLDSLENHMERVEKRLDIVELRIDTVIRMVDGHSSRIKDLELAR